MSLPALLLSSLLVAPQQLDRALLTNAVEPYLAAQNVPGSVVAIVKAGQPTLIEAFGVSDVSSKSPMQGHTRFQVGSVTKPLTASLLVLLAHEDKLDLQGALAKHLPADVQLSKELGSISLAQLLCHASGLPREARNRQNLPDSPSVMLPMSQEQLLAGLTGTELESKPGERWGYSNLGYALLGAVAAEAGGKPYEVLLQERVLQPLGMKHSAVYTDGRVPQDLATCYWPEDETWIARDPWKFGSSASFSGLVTNAPDLVLFLQAQLDTSETAIFNKQQRSFLHTAAVQVDAERGRGMSHGWFVDPLPFGNQFAIGHGGELDGHSAVIAFFPGMQAGLVVLCNKGGKSAENLAYALMGAVMPHLTR